MAVWMNAHETVPSAKTEACCTAILLLISFPTNSLSPSSILQQTNHQKEQSSANTSYHVTVTILHDFLHSFTFPQIINTLPCFSFLSRNSSCSVLKPFQYHSQPTRNLGFKACWYQPRLCQLFQAHDEGEVKVLCVQAMLILRGGRIYPLILNFGIN